MKTNIDKLHDVVNNKDEYGKTFAKCHDVAGFIELDIMNTLYVIMDYYNDIDYIIPILYGVLEEHELSIERVDKFSILSEGTMIKFIIVRDEYKMNGSYGGYIKMGHYE